MLASLEDAFLFEFYITDLLFYVKEVCFYYKEGSCIFWELVLSIKKIESIQIKKIFKLLMRKFLINWSKVVVLRSNQAFLLYSPVFHYFVISLQFLTLIKIIWSTSQQVFVHKSRFSELIFCHRSIKLMNFNA